MKGRNKIAFILALLICGILIGRHLAVNSYSLKIIEFLLFAGLVIAMVLLDPLVGLLILLAIAIFFQPIDKLWVGLLRGHIHALDIILAIFYVSWLLKYTMHKITIPSFPAKKLIALFILVLSIPIVIGLLKHHTYMTILRDARVPFYYLLVYPIISIVSDKNKLIKLLKVTFFLTIIAASYYAFALVLNKPFNPDVVYISSNEIRWFRSYGFTSSYAWKIMCFFLSLSIFSFNPFISKSVKYLLFFSTILFLFITLQQLVRQNLIAIIGSTFFLYFLFAFIEKKFAVLLRPGKYGFIIITIVLFTVLISPRTLHRLAGNPIIERYATVIFPEIDPGAAASTQYRIEALTYFANLQKALVGHGYGATEEEFESRYASDVTTQAYLHHSGIGWALYRLGIILSVVIAILILSLFREIIRSLKLINSSQIRAICYGLIAYFVSVIITSPVCNMLFDFNGVYGVPVIFTLGILLGTTTYSTTK